MWMDFGTLPSFITGEKFLFFNLGAILFFQKDVKNTVCCNTVYELQPLKPILWISESDPYFVMILQGYLQFKGAA